MLPCILRAMYSCSSVAVIFASCVHALRDSTPNGIEVTENTCPTHCDQTNIDSDRYQRSLFRLTGEQAKKVSWKLAPGQNYVIRASSDCRHTADLPSSKANLVSWFDPINVSDYSIEVFIDPRIANQMRLENRDFWLCVDSQKEEGCLCKLESDTSQVGHGLIGPLVQQLPASMAGPAVDWLFSMELLCPQPWIPDVFVSLAATGVLVFLVFVLEALYSFRREAVIAESKCSLGVIVPSAWQDAAQCFGALSFVLLGHALQTSTMQVVMGASSSESLVWAITSLSIVINFLAAWRFHHVACRAILVHSFLSKGIVVLVPKSKRAEVLIIAVIMLYGLLVVVGSLGETSMLSIARLAIFVMGSLAGPFFALIKSIRVGEETNRRNSEVQMQGTDFVAFKKHGDVAVLNWKSLVSACRAGDDPMMLAGPLEPTSPGETESDANLSDFFFFRDVVWCRRLVFSCTGSRAAYMFLPSFVLTMVLLTTCGAYSATSYLCSRGQFESLQRAGSGESFDFEPWQDRYILLLDASSHEITMVASASPTTREVQFDLPKSKTNHSDLRALVANIDLVDVPVPRVASFIAAGWRPSQPPRRYGVRMAPVHLLPARIMVTDHAGFNRCLSWATLPGSTLSIPRQAQNLTITVFLTEFVLSIPCEAPDVRFSWTEHLKTSLSCKDLCEDDADCLSSFTAGKNGCFFAKHHHSFHERSCGSAELVTLGGPKAMNSHALLSRLNGCIGNGRSCGTAVIKNVSTLSFEPVLPDWQADGQGTLDFSLALTTGGTETVSQVAKVSLRQGLPFASDVLVHLEAQTLENTSKTIPAYGNVSSAGDITITVTQYDPLELQMGRIMRMTLAPVLPDRLFQVIWLTEQPSAVSAPHFQRCEESSLLRTRLKACNGSSDWLVEPFTTSVSRFFPGEERSNIQFVVETKDADEHKLWPEKLVFSVSVRFVAVDAPAAWSAEKGCSVVQAWDQQEVFEAFIKSPDAFCRILDQGCHDRSKFAGIEKNIRKAFSAYFVRDFNRFRLVTFEQQVQGYVCAYEYGAMGPDENRTFQSTRAWTYVPNEGLGGFESWDAPKSKFNYLRVDDFNGYVYNVPIIPLPIFLQSIARMSTSRPSALNFLSALCQATMRKYNRSEVIEDGVFSWIEASVDTGNMNVTSVVLQCLDRLKGGRFGGNQAKRLARAVWSQTSRRAAEGAPMPFELARLVSSWRDVEVLKEVVSLLVQNQRGKWFPQLLAAFGGSSALQQWDSWDVSIQESALLGELAAVLQCTRELKRLSVHASASVKALPLYMMRTGGLVQAFRGLNNLKFLNFGPMLGETTGSFTEAISHLPLVKLVVRGMRLSECGPLAGMQLQIVCLQSWKESDFQLSAEAYSSNLHWTRLHLQLMGSLSLADTAALLHRLVKLELLTIEIHEVPTRDEWKDFLGAVRGMPSLKELLIRGNNGQPCLPSDKKEVAPEFERLPQSMTTIMFDQCLDRNKACGILKHHLPEQIQCKESGFKFCDHPTANL